MVEETITSQDVNFLSKPILSSTPNYFTRACKVWSNNFTITLSKNISFVEYSVEFSPEIGNENTFLKKKIFGLILPEKLVGEKVIFTGDACFIKVNIKTPTDDLYVKTVEFKNQSYDVKLTKTNRSFDIKSKNLSSSITPARKMIIELMINEIIRSNPTIDVERRLFVRNNATSTLNFRGGQVNFYPGYTTSVICSGDQILLNVTLKNKFIQTENCYNLMQGKTEDEINNQFIGRSVKTTYSKKNYIIHSVNFSKTPSNTEITTKDRVILLHRYYKEAHAVTIKNLNQKLFEVKTRENEIIYLVPELCLLAGIEDCMIQDRNFMQELALKTKFEPEDRISKTKEISKIFQSKEKIKVNDTTFKPSSFDLSTLYGITLDTNGKEAAGNVIKNPSFASKQVNLEHDGLQRKPVHLDTLSGGKVLIVYHQSSYSDAENLSNLLTKAGKDPKLALPEIEWAEVNSTRPNDWIAKAEQGKNYKIVIFLLDNRKESLYTHIKKHSLVTVGYLSQVVKVEKVRDQKRGLSAATNILYQINQKTGGTSYILRQDDEIKNANLMIVGVDSSHISGRRTGVAMCATINKEFSKYFTKENIILEKNKETLVFAVGKFINLALAEYFKLNKALPSGIIIYRQGVSKEQKEFLKHEIASINNLLNGLDANSVIYSKTIPYYYVIVNKKTTFKFFENDRNRFSNPQGGLYVSEGVTEGKYFEFFLQPQKVTQGSATPTHYHVAFGNFNNPSLVPKLTFYLCFIYPNWVGPIRVPMVLMLSEKLSKLVSKYLLNELNDALKNTLCYL